MNVPPFGISILRARKSRGEKKQDGQKKVCGNVTGRRKRKQT
jgi:1,4-alpha-glucan branching enzyme